MPNYRPRKLRRAAPRLRQQQIDRDAARAGVEHAIDRPAELFASLHVRERPRIGRKGRIVQSEQQNARVRLPAWRYRETQIHRSLFEPFHEVEPPQER
jgi:hypothetical protein